MAQEILLQNSSYGITAKGYFGFSWTCLFFGWMVPLIRGELLVALIWFLFFILTIWFGGFLILNVIMAFSYNKQYMHRMLLQGYVLVGEPEIIEQAKKKLSIL